VFGYNWKKIKQRWEGSVLQRQFAEDIVPKSTCLFGYRHGGASVKRWSGIKPFPWNWKKIHMNYWDWKE
jgi:hypothetical protein